MPHALWSFLKVMFRLTEKWNDELFGVLKKAGGVVYSNFAVGFDNIDVAAATKHGVFVGFQNFS